jgi:predicted TPR repeat methyltransferase
VLIILICYLDQRLTSISRAGHGCPLQCSPVSTPDDTTLHNAIAAHNAGRLTEAEVGYRRALRKRPTDAGALYGLGLLYFHQGSLEAAIQHVSRSLVFAPANGRAWNTLGSMYMSTGLADEAKQAYGRAASVVPGMSEAWYNLGICHRNAGDIEKALQCLRTAASCDAPHPQSYEALATLLYQQSRGAEASEVYQQWFARDPHNAKARHMASAANGQTGKNGQAMPRASDSYVREHFDAAAASFDRNLADLEYRVPGLVAKALGDVAPRDGAQFYAVLDAGCGTGLCGPLLRPHCGHLVGVDLSPKMLDRARERGCYDELAAAEIGQYMRSSVEGFDAIVCADTLVYFGPLDEPFAAVRSALRAAGVLIFTVEALEANQGVDHKLTGTGRYAHTEDYLRRSLSHAGFELEGMRTEVLRQERSAPVSGFLAVARW